MKFTVLAVGTKMPSWVQQGVDEYTKRLPRDFPVNFVELPLGKRGKGQASSVAIKQEGQSLLAAIPKGDKVVALDVQGQSWSTEKLAQNIEQWSQLGSGATLLIGGPDGLAAECVQRADVTWSLSDLTLPHPLVRVLLAEQLYRAWSIIKRHPYHK